MFSLSRYSQRLHDGLDRREWLRVGGLGLGGLTLSGLSEARSAPTPGAERSFGRAKRCILFFLLGGPPQHETWDPKPAAPAEIRGPFKPIASSVPGLQVCELMPRTARLAHHCAVLRAVATGDNAHSSSGYFMLTGQPHAPMNQESATPKAPNDWPTLGAVVKHLRPGSGGRLPAAIRLPEHIWNTGNFPWPGQDAGWLGRAADPWLVHCDPNSPTFQVPALNLPADTTPLRFGQRRSLLDQVNRQLDGLERVAGSHYDHHFRQAVDLVSSSAARQAFDLNQEPAAVRDRYGRHRWGQSVLLARRLIEAGVSLVQVNWTRIAGKDNDGAWDTHAKNAANLKEYLMPMMDESFSSLLEDLHVRGLLDETLVVWLGEFGRTPRHNAAAGRDHWGPVFSLALAGGGIRGGSIYGASDSRGAYPKEGRVTPPDFLATIFHLLGIRPDTEIHDPFSRPQPLTRGQVARQII
jgi:hypothetical protein